MPRQARLDSPGTLHHIMVRGIEGRVIVCDDQDRKDFLSRLGRIASETDTAIYAWALMNNHAHILLRSGPTGLPHFMRRLLTGYATYHNRRHQRHGHLFQNRYKSIICEEEPYFKELLRYIHLNPLRAGQVESLDMLDRYRWCGHAVVVGSMKNDWQDRDYVLKWFGLRYGQAKNAYRRFIQQGMDQGHRPDLVGGGLIRSQGGWASVQAMRRAGIREKSDERILGGGEFVMQLIRQCDESRRKHFSAHERLQSIPLVIEEVCKKQQVTVEEIRSGNRRHQVSRVRSELAKILVEDYGLSLTEAGGNLGVSPPAVSRLIRRFRKKV
jgi:REP element-mobilizing transposase RayT